MKKLTIIVTTSFDNPLISMPTEYQHKEFDISQGKEAREYYIEELKKQESPHTFVTIHISTKALD